MPEPDTIALARETVRAGAGLDGKRTSQEKKQKTGIASAPQQANGDSLPEQPAPAAGALPQQTPSDREAISSDASLPGGAAQPGIEVELKLLVDPDRLADFNDAPIIAANARSKGTRKHLKDVYYDTPERTLWRNGLSLRVRQSGARFVQTVKANGDDPLRRGEWEASVPSIAPDLVLGRPSFRPDSAPICNASRSRRSSAPISAGTSASSTCLPERSRSHSITVFSNRTIDRCR